MARRPVVAIVGRPNVGKSTLFNRIIKSRLSIVEDIPGVTRDRIHASAEWESRRFTLVDTGGIQSDPGDDITSQSRKQAEVAIAEADVILFVVDSKQGVTPEDTAAADLLRRADRPVLLVANKVDDPRHFDYGLWSLGLGEPIPVSAVHGDGVADLLDKVVESFPDDADTEPSGEDQTIRVAIVGRPNVGKSSMVNRILGEERAIVSDEPGTTRDAIDTPFEYAGRDYVIVDTAGVRRRSKVTQSVEKFSVMRTLSSIERADVVVTVIDGTQGVTEQDVRIAGYGHEAGRAAVIAVNKWDIVERDERTVVEFERKVRYDLSYMDYAPIVFVSALTGRRVNKLMEAVTGAAMEHRRRVPTGALNRVMEDAILRFPHPAQNGKQVKIFYITQVDVAPPTFAAFCNYPELVHFSYKRYMENKVREAFGFAGTPIVIVTRKRE